MIIAIYTYLHLINFIIFHPTGSVILGSEIVRCRKKPPGVDGDNFIRYQKKYWTASRSLHKNKKQWKMFDGFHSNLYTQLSNLQKFSFRINLLTDEKHQIPILTKLHWDGLAMFSMFSISLHGNQPWTLPIGLFLHLVFWRFLALLESGGEASADFWSSWCQFRQIWKERFHGECGSKHWFQYMLIGHESLETKLGSTWS